MSKTLRLIIPEWHGGVNPNYVFGSELLSVIAPPSEADETVKITVDTNFNGNPAKIDGIDAGDFLLKQMQETSQVLHSKQPDKVIVFGGDCSVSQAPFDYLSEKYGGSLGLIWLDAHPDISGTAVSAHLHEMVLANLIGLNPDSAITHVNSPFAKEKVALAGLIKERIRPMDQACLDENLKIISPGDLRENSEILLEWVREQNITKLAVHWDLDVLSPDDFRSIYPGEPYIDVDSFSAAVGRMTLKEVGRALRDAGEAAEIVGLSITEHLPWDAFNLRHTLASISIFKEAQHEYTVD